MKLIKQIQEDAAIGSVGVGSIAAYPGAGQKKRAKKKSSGLFAGGILQRTNESLKRKPGRKIFVLENAEFDENDAEAKLKGAEKVDKAKSNCKIFGLQDDDGNTVKIYVKAGDADDFEQSLESALNSDKSVAEIVFELNKEFDIVDAEWGEIPEDEEETNVPANPQAGQNPQQPGTDQKPEQGNKDSGGEQPPSKEKGDEDAQAGDADKAGEEPPADDGDQEPPADDSVEPDDDIKGTLKDIISMLKADIEAKKAEAEAKKAEEARKAEEERHKAAAHQVKMDSEMLDAEEYFKKQKEKDKESRQMELLAKYRHAKAKDNASGDIDLDSFESAATSIVDAIFESKSQKTKKVKKVKADDFCSSSRRK